MNDLAPTPGPTDVNVKTFWQKVTGDVKYLWDNDKIFLVVFGVLILFAKGSNLVIDFLAFRSKQEVDSATKQDAALKAQEDAAKEQADDLVKKANSLPSQQQPVDENWDKKK